MDLSTRVNSKKHVDFSDARYQLSEKLKPSNNKNTRSTFTLYDDRQANKVVADEISAAYALSDKKIPIGELLNKMADLIADLVDERLDSETDAVYAWKYSQVIVKIFEDRVKHGEQITMFDNSLKNTLINCSVFTEKFPNRYTLRTNFFDKNVLAQLSQDVTGVFKEHTIPLIHKEAIKQSKETAETHRNATLDRIVDWAVEQYKCETNSYVEIEEDPITNLYYAKNTVILHMPNGYDISIIGYVGTEYDDSYSLSLFNANSTNIDDHSRDIAPEKVREKLQEASQFEKVDPLTILIEIEEQKNSVYNQQLQILQDIRPMIKEDLLRLTAAASIVGQDYIWGCHQYRLTHADLPDDFKLSDVKLPQYEENKLDEKEIKEQTEVLIKFNNAIDTAKTSIEEPTVEQLEPIVDTTVAEEPIIEELPKVEETIEQEVQGTPIDNSEPVKIEQSVIDQHNTVVPEYSHQVQPIVEPKTVPTVQKEEPIQNTVATDSLFDEPVFPAEAPKQMAPKMSNNIGLNGDIDERKKAGTFSKGSTLLPGVRPTIKPKPVEDLNKSVTANAVKINRPAPLTVNAVIPNANGASQIEKKLIEKTAETIVETVDAKNMNHDEIDDLFA